MTKEKTERSESGTGALPLDIVLIGCGTVGAELLAQLDRQTRSLAERGIDLRVVVIANSRRMLVQASGLELDAWRDRLAVAAPLDLAAIIGLASSLANPVLVDCSASDSVPEAYPSFLKAGYNIVTPNKRGNTGTMPAYRELKRLAMVHGRQYLYEATVGAGLPVMDNLGKLFLAGDRLISFSGILSGSLSFLLGRLEEGASFSGTVREAMEKGFTEPDPRDDLSGRDVARKVLILAREAGLSMELPEVALAGLVPAEYMAMDKADFIERLPELDPHFARLLSNAAADGKVLRFAGAIENGKASAGLVAVRPEHPLFAVKGGENALAFRTHYYDPIPLVVRGYGAGAQVTAAGVFGDILRTLGRNGGGA